MKKTFPKQISKKSISFLAPITTEKAVKLLELENLLMFEVDRRLTKLEIKNQVEETFNVKIKSIRTLTRENKKIAYIRFDQKNPAIDIATKLGMI